MRGIQSRRRMWAGDIAICSRYSRASRGGLVWNMWLIRVAEVCRERRAIVNPEIIPRQAPGSTMYKVLADTMFQMPIIGKSAIAKLR